MKKQFKSMMSLAWALALLLQLAGPAAFAAEPRPLRGEETLVCEIHLTRAAQDPETQTPGEDTELSSDPVCSLELDSGEPDGKQALVEGSTLKLEQLLKGTLSVTPPEGYYVEKLQLKAGDKQLTLPSQAAKDTAVLTLKGEDLTDKDGKPDEKLFAPLAEREESDKLTLSLSVLPLRDELTVHYELQGAAGEIPDVTLDKGQPHTSAAEPTAPEGKVFAGWLLRYENGSSLKLAAEESFTPCADCTLEAQWKNILTVTASPAEGGTVSGGGSYAAGEDVTLSATPNEGYSFVNWTEGDAVVGTEASYSFTVSSARSLTANFQLTSTPTPSTYSVTVEAGEHGSAGANPASGETNTEVTLTATPDEGYRFKEWQVLSGGVNINDNKFMIGSESVVVKPVFELIPSTATYNVSVEVGPAEGGTVTGAGSYEADASVTLTAAPNEGYDFVNWTEGETVVSAEASYSFTVSGERSLKANFKAKPVSKIQLSIEAVSASKPYDGTPLKASDYNENGFTNGYKVTGLAEGHTVSGLTVSGELTKPGPEPKQTEVDVSALKITDKDGKDVTAQYEVKPENVKAGTLTVTKQKLLITAISTTVEYTGEIIEAKTLSKGDFVNGYKVEGLPAGHMLSQIHVTGSGVNVTRENEAYLTDIDQTTPEKKITVSKGTGETAENVTDCFEIKTETGALKITPRPLTVTAISGKVSATGSPIYAKGYSGDGFTHGYKAEGLASGHDLDGDFVTGSGTEPGKFTTGIDTSKLKIVDKDKKDVTANYSITPVSGEITIVAKTDKQTPITVTAKASKVYDATPLTIGNSHLSLSQGTLPANYKIEADFSPVTSITDVQKVSVSLSNVRIKDDKGKDVTDQYQITTVSGSLEVTRMPLTLTAESASKTYDGKALVNRNVRATALASRNHDLSVEYEILNSEGKVIKNGAVNVGTYTKRISSVTIKEGSKDVTNNYAITRVEGKLTINAASGNPNSRNPRTGDESNLLLWLTLLMASAVLLGLIAFVLLRRRRPAAGPLPLLPKRTRRRK